MENKKRGEWRKKSETESKEGSDGGREGKKSGVGGHREKYYCAP